MQRYAVETGLHDRFPLPTIRPQRRRRAQKRRDMEGDMDASADPVPTTASGQPTAATASASVDRAAEPARSTIFCPDCGRPVLQTNVALHRATGCGVCFLDQLGRGRPPAGATRLVTSHPLDISEAELEESVMEQSMEEDEEGTEEGGIRESGRGGGYVGFGPTLWGNAHSHEVSAAAIYPDDAVLDEDMDGYPYSSSEDEVRLIRRVVDLSDGGENGGTDSPEVVRRVFDLNHGDDEHQSVGGGVVDLAESDDDDDSVVAVPAFDRPPTTVGRVPQADTMDTDGGPPSGAAEHEWACPRCTLLNPTRYRRCDACRLLKPALSPPVRRRGRREQGRAGRTAAGGALSSSDRVRWTDRLPAYTVTRHPLTFDNSFGLDESEESDDDEDVDDIDNDDDGDDESTVTEEGGTDGENRGAIANPAIAFPALGSSSILGSVAAAESHFGRQLLERALARAGRPLGDSARGASSPVNLRNHSRPLPSPDLGEDSNGGGEVVPLALSDLTSSVEAYTNGARSRVRAAALGASTQWGSPEVASTHNDGAGVPPLAAATASSSSFSTPRFLRGGSARGGFAAPHSLSTAGTSPMDPPMGDPMTDMLVRRLLLGSPYRSVSRAEMGLNGLAGGAEDLGPADSEMVDFEEAGPRSYLHSMGRSARHPAGAAVTSLPFTGILRHPRQRTPDLSLRDRHRHHDIDGMSYEQLLQMFGDGSENRGADDFSIKALPVATIRNVKKDLPEEKRNCSICLDEFENGHRRRTLPCLHGFHEDCVDRWLRSNASCPICKHAIGA